MKKINLKKELLDIEIEKIIDMYKSGISSDKIGKMLEISAHTIRDILRYNNIKLRVYPRRKKFESINGIFNVDYRRNWVL